MLFKVFDALLAQSAFPTTDQPLHQVLGILRHVCDMGWELKALLEKLIACYKEAGGTIIKNAFYIN